MRLRLSKPFLKEYARLPLAIRKKVDRQVGYLKMSLRHPGLHAKKVTGAADIWEARIDIHYRLTFQIVNETVVLRRVGPHDILRKP